MDLTGREFGRLTALISTPKRIRGYVVWICSCVCGGSIEVSSQLLLSGGTRSCGCIRYSSEFRELRANKTRESWRDPEVKAKRAAGISRAKIGHVVSIDQRQRISKTLTGHKIPQEVIEKRSRTHRERFKAGLYEATRQKTRKPHTRETMDKIAAALRGKKRPQEVSKKVSSSVTRKWQEPEYRARVLEARQTSPNLLERAASLELEPIGFKFVGNGSFWVHSKDGSHNPDFRKPGSKLLVEIWGDYWHAGEDPDSLVSWYAERGWKCLVIWEHEIRTTPIVQLVQQRFLMQPKLYLKGQGSARRRPHLFSPVISGSSKL